MTSYSIMRGGQAYYNQGRLLLRLWELGATKDWGAHADKDQSEETQD